jgi:hypothetical protein
MWKVWHFFKCAVALLFIAVGFFNKDFTPNSWTSKLFWEADEDARIPRSIAGPVFVVFGLVLLYRELMAK